MVPSIYSRACYFFIQPSCYHAIATACQLPVHFPQTANKRPASYVDFLYLNGAMAC